MLIYRFRVTSEEFDSFLREIEIQPGQTFLDFHHVILESVDMHHCEKASFFITDKMFKKEKEITLKNDKRKVRKYDEDLDIVVTETETVPLMKAARLKEFIEDPHQRMIYEFSQKGLYVLHIELYKIYRSDEIASFPRYLKRVGELPKPVEQPPALPVAPVAVPKVPKPKVVTDVPDVSKLDGIEEDEAELAAIESEIGEMFHENEEPGAEAAEEETTLEPYAFEGQHTLAEADDESDPGLDHIEDYEDIESLDRRLSGYDRESDDY